MAAINDNIILDEAIEGVFALKNYKEINEICNKKNDEENLILWFDVKEMKCLNI